MLSFFFFCVGAGLGFWFRGTSAGQWLKKAFSKAEGVK